MSGVLYWPYELRSKGQLNSRRSETTHQGMLIQIDGGVGCIHPWTELGDLPLSDQLERLRRGQDTDLIRSAKSCAKFDAEARHKQVSLFWDQDVMFPPQHPRNHWLAGANDDPEKVAESGFRKVKLKVGPSLNGVSEEIDRWRICGFKVRLDANESVNFGEWVSWWMDLSQGHRDAIDWVEDPCPWGRWRWKFLQSIGMPVAADRDVGKRLFSSDVAVYKPATDGSDSEANALDTRIVEWAYRKENRRYSVTSYMDHAVGQMWAAHVAAILREVVPGKMDDCGLLTHLQFENDAFFEQVQIEDTRIVPPGGTGLGFDDLLEKLPWKRLT